MAESNEANKGRGTKTDQRGQYAKFEPLVDTAIEKLKLLLDSRNEAIALGAIKVVLERTVPEMKAVEITGQGGGPLLINLDINGADKFFSVKQLSGQADQGN